MWQFLSKFLNIEFNEEVDGSTATNSEIKGIEVKDEHLNTFCRDHNREDFDSDCLEENEDAKYRNETQFRDIVVTCDDMEENFESLSASMSGEQKSEKFGDISTTFEKCEDNNEFEVSNEISCKSSNIAAKESLEGGENIPLIRTSETDKLNEVSMGTTLPRNFDRESYILDNVIPKLNKFTIRKSCNFFGKIIKSKKLEGEDRSNQKNKCKNYTMWSRVQLMDMNHMTVLLTSLGQWHGLNLAFQDQNPEEFQKWTKELSNVMPNYLTKESFLKVILKNMKKVLKMLETSGHHELVEKYVRKMGFFGDTLLRKSNEVSVIAFHADCWIDNIVFEYESCGNMLKPSHASFVNFQLSMVDSPIRDLSYLFYSYSDDNILQDFDFLLHVYHHALSCTMAKLGSDVDTIFPFEKLRKEWKKYGMFGVIMHLFEIFDEEDLVKCGKGIIDASDPTLDRKIQEECNSRVLNVFVHYGQKFL